MKYLVLGSSGQIGSALVDYLKTKNETPIEFDIVNSKRQDLRLEHNRLLESRVKEADFVFFLAFDVGGSAYLDKYQHTYEFLSNNIRIMEHVFFILKKYKKKFIFTSSQMSNMTYSSYGVLKSLGEYYTRSLDGMVVKLWNVYGYEKDLKKSHVITDFILKAIRNGKITLRTDGTETRQFLFVKDCCECLFMLSKKYDKIPKNKNLHVSSFQWNSIMDVATIVASFYPNTKIIQGNKNDTVQQNKRNEPDPYILSYWKPKTPLQTGIKIVANQYLKTYGKT